LELHRAEIESKSGQSIKIKAKNSVRGLDDVIGRSANLAVLSCDAKRFYAASGFNEQVVASLSETVVGKGRVLFVVHPSNTVESLSVAQLRAVLTGQVTNWKDVGGPDSPILIFCVDRTLAYRVVADDALNIETLATGAFVRTDSTEILPAARLYPGAVALMSQWDISPGYKVVNDSAVSFPIVVVSSGVPGPEAQAVIKAIQECLAQ